MHSFRVVLAIAAGIALILVLDPVFHWAGQQARSRFHLREFFALGLTALLVIALVFSPGFTEGLSPGQLHESYYNVGSAPALYEFFSRQPKSILIASLAREVDNLPTFSKRSILVGQEYAVPFHLGYYRQIRQRTIDLIRAQYSQDLSEVRSFIRTYKVDFFLLHGKAFTSHYLARQLWIKQFQPAAKEALESLERGNVPVLAKAMERCSVFEARKFIVMDAKCIEETP